MFVCVCVCVCVCVRACVRVCVCVWGGGGMVWGGMSGGEVLQHNVRKYTNQSSLS